MGRSCRKKRSWRQVDTSETGKSAGLRSAANSSLFMIDGGVQSLSSKSMPSKNTMKAAKKYMKSKVSSQPENSFQQPSVFDLWSGCGNQRSVKARPAVLATSDPVFAGIAKKSLQPAHPGTSYNPSPEDREKAIQLAYELHMQENKSEQLWNEKLQQAKAAAIGTENDIEDDADVADTIIVRPPVRAEDRLTKATRNKRRRHKILMAEASIRKQNKLVLRQIDTIDKLAVVKPSVKIAQKTRRIQLGKFKVKPEFPAVLLSEEVTSNLREVAFQPNILRDTFLNFQRKGLIEARHKVKPTPVRVKLYNRYKDRE